MRFSSFVPVLVVIAACVDGSNRHNTPDAFVPPVDAPGSVCGDGLLEAPETCDDHNTEPGDGCSSQCTIEGADVTLTANWSFATIANNGATTPSACPGGQFDTAAIVAQALDANGDPIGTCGGASPSGTCFIDLYNCTDLTGTQQLPQGQWLVWISITSTDGSQTYADTISTKLDLTASASITATILDDGGYFSLAWSLRGAQSNNALTCAQANADGVDIATTLAGTANGFADTFSCDDGYGVTGGLPDGNYTASVSALNAQTQAVGVAPAMTTSIGTRNAITDLGSIEIPIDGL